VNMPQIFSFNDAQVRIIEKDGQPWFVLKDVCEVLELDQVAGVKRRLSDDVISNHPIPDALGRQQDTTIINEDGLYDVILESRKPEARAFRKWVTSEVLPSIRQTGQYGLPKSLPEALRFAAVLAEKNIQLQLEGAQKDQIINELQPKASYVDQILKSKSTVTITQIAKDYGLSGQELNKILHQEDVQYKMNGQWLLYRKHQNQGYTKSNTVDIHHTDGSQSVKMNTQWTQKGRLFIHEILKSRSIIPFMDRESA